MHDNRVTTVTQISVTESVQIQRKRRTKADDIKKKKQKAQRQARKAHR